MILRYFIVTHGLQILLFLFVVSSNPSWRTGELDILTLIILVLQVLTASILIKTKFVKHIWQILASIIAKISALFFRLDLFIAILYLSISIFFFTSSLNSYRYESSSIMSSGSYLLYLSLFIKPFGYLYFLRYYLFNSHNSQLNPVSKRPGYFYLLGQCFLLSGVTGGAMLLASVLVFFKLSQRQIYFIFPALSLAVGLLFIQVNAIKWKVDFYAAINILLELDWIEYGKYLITRLSISHYGFQYYLHESYSPQYIELFKAGLSRVLSLNLTEVESINRYNYEHLSLYVDNRSGTSPGILASFQIMYGNFVGLILAPLYIAFIFYPFRNKGLIGLLVLLIFAQEVYKTPFQSLLFLDPNFEVLVLFIFLSTEYFQWSQRYR